MAAQRSVGRFCSVVTKDLTSLALIDAANLGEGAQVFVLSNSRSYRLVFALLGSFLPVTVSAPGVGTWIQENAENDQAYFIYATAPSGAVSIIQNTWHALPTGTGLYAQAGTKACWSFNSTTGVATYTGPAATFQITATFSLDMSVANEAWECDISRDGASIGGTSQLSTCVRDYSGTVGSICCSVLSPPVTMLPATAVTFQGIVRDLSGNANMSISKFQMFFQLLADK